jgi:hypothetical protein
MHQSNAVLTSRRSSRVETSIPILVTALDPAAHFSEVCETLVVSAHGCAMRSRIKLDTGVRLHLHSRDGRDTTAQVVSCQPIGSDSRSWRLGARLDRPDNFWGVPKCPKDWAAAATPVLAHSRAVPATATSVLHAVPAAASKSPEIAPDHVARQQLSDEHIRRMVGEALRPLQAEVIALKQRLQHKEANPSRFEVSLASIPPELEQQLQLRLRKELEPKVLEEARQQSTHLLVAAQAAIDQKTREAHEHFSRHLGDERRALEQQAKEISKRLSQIMRERIDLGVNEFQQKVVDGGNRLKQFSQQLLEFLQNSVNEEINTRRGELEELRRMFTAESSRLGKRTEQLDSRIAQLSDTVRSLESGLDQRLNQMCSRIVGETRSELESAAAAVFTELTTRGAQALGKELDQVCEKLTSVQKEAVLAASGSVEVQARNALETFEQSMENLARVSLERWRAKLTKGLSALAKNFDQQFQ